MASSRFTGSGPVIELRAGCARWLRDGHAGVSLLGLAGILGSGARPAWTAAALVALALVHFATARRMRGPGSHGRLRLFADGTAVFLTGAREIPALQLGGAWFSRWFCAVPLQRLEDNRCMTAIVCRSLNAPDDYRRLLVRLRLREALAPSRDLGRL
jgi:hypothetical protein